MTVQNDSNGAIGFDCDVLVVGGGPAGSTVATLLAREGLDVVMLEKAQHPRFHIGESLLPANGPLFDRLGVRAGIEQMGITKWGVEFVSPDHAHKTFVEFADAWDKSMPSAWQVRRSEMDELLFRHAQQAGAQALEGWQVHSVQFDSEGATIQAQAVASHAGGAQGQAVEAGARAAREQREWRSRYVVDASGRDTLLATRMGHKRKHPWHNSAALYGHFRGAHRLPGKLEGNISIFWFEHGWFWFIPLADGSTSVGAVCWPSYLKQRKKPLAEFFLDTIALAPQLQARLQGAQLVDETAYATGNYAYASQSSCGPRHVLLGDAYAFIDPVFSSGVYLAMASAFAAQPLIAATLQQGPSSRAAASARRQFDAHMRRGPREFSWFIVRMTNPAMRELFMGPRNVLRMKEAVLSLLAGDIFSRTPFRPSLRAFKTLYYAMSAAHPLRSWRAWRRRRQLLQLAEPTVTKKPMELA